MLRSRLATFPSRALLPWVLLALGLAPALAESPPGEGPALPRHVDQQDIVDGRWRLKDLEAAGLRLFTTPFNRHDGYGDGPYDPADPVTPGGRPTLQGNGTFLRLNGLDAQTCLECHSFVSAATMPPLLGIGGFGGSNANALIKTRNVDPTDLGDLDGAADFDGRMANPPFVFGAGGVEMLALEMTEDLQAIRRAVVAGAPTRMPLVTKGISFGHLSSDASGRLDTSEVVGVDPDLVVRPFGRKGDVPSLRAFDTDAMMFHFGMQPTEVVGEGVDGDGDGVVDEVTAGDLSALGVFVAMLDKPVMERPTAAARRGERLFHDVGCATCHVPLMHTRGRHLRLRQPEVLEDPEANVYLRLDLHKHGPRFRRSPEGGVQVPLFADLKRHDMGPDLAEDFAGADAQRNREFTTARLWGVADSAPYLHDGRATTLTDAILFHGGEAQEERDAFAALSAGDREDLLAFLRTLRTPGASRVPEADPRDEGPAADEDPGRGAGREEDREKDDEEARGRRGPLRGRRG